MLGTSVARWLTSLGWATTARRVLRRFPQGESLLTREPHSDAGCKPALPGSEAERTTIVVANKFREDTFSELISAFHSAR